MSIPIKFFRVFLSIAMVGVFLSGCMHSESVHSVKHEKFKIGPRIDIPSNESYPVIYITDVYWGFSKIRIPTLQIFSDGTAYQIKNIGWGGAYFKKGNIGEDSVGDILRKFEEDGIYEITAENLKDEQLNLELPPMTGGQRMIITVITKGTFYMLDTSQVATYSKAPKAILHKRIQGLLDFIYSKLPAEKK